MPEQSSSESIAPGTQPTAADVLPNDEPELDDLVVKEEPAAEEEAGEPGEVAEGEVAEEEFAEEKAVKEEAPDFSDRRRGRQPCRGLRDPLGNLGPDLAAETHRTEDSSSYPR